MFVGPISDSRSDTFVFHLCTACAAMAVQSDVASAPAIKTGDMVVFLEGREAIGFDRMKDKGIWQCSHGAFHHEDMLGKQFGSRVSNVKPQIDSIVHDDLWEASSSHSRSFRVLNLLLTYLV